MTIYCGNICYPGFVSCPKKIILIDAFNVDLILKGADWKDREWTSIAYSQKTWANSSDRGLPPTYHLPL